MRIGLLVSGELGFSILKELYHSRDINFVLTDNNSTNIIEFCTQKKIPVFKGNPRKGRCSDFVKDMEIDVLLSVNYLFIIDDELINLPKLLAFNIHGSLLPKYRGRTPHVWAIINNEEYTGITAHIIDKNCDTGYILEQIKIPIDKRDTGADILSKFEQEYSNIIKKVLKSVDNNSLKPEMQNETLATYFGKRTPEDGQINWNWQKERIYNWVRAQADPYPGAFTFNGKEKLIIDRIQFDSYGYDKNTPNGQILSVNPVRIKTPNGAILITKFRNIPKGLEINKTLS